MGNTSIASLVQAVVRAPAGRRRVALALAEMQDAHDGEFSTTMVQIASAAKLSKVQTRKHVQTLLAEGVLTASGSVHGGAPGVGPSYSFNVGLLEQLVTCSPDLFEDYASGVLSETADVYRFESSGAHFVAHLVGTPGARRVVFWRVDEACMSYGDVELRTLLRDPRVRGGWHCHLLPRGNPDVPYEQIFCLSSEVVAALAAWAQSAALGRVESLITA